MVGGGGRESVIALFHKRLGAVPGMGKAQAAQTDQFVLMDWVFSEEKKKSAVIFSLLAATSFKALFGKLVHKPAPILLMFKESILPKYSFLGFNGSTL